MPIPMNLSGTQHTEFEINKIKNPGLEYGQKNIDAAVASSSHRIAMLDRYKDQNALFKGNPIENDSLLRRKEEMMQYDFTRQRLLAFVTLLADIRQKLNALQNIVTSGVAR